MGSYTTRRTQWGEDFIKGLYENSHGIAWAWYQSHDIKEQPLNSTYRTKSTDADVYTHAGIEVELIVLAVEPLVHPAAVGRGPAEEAVGLAPLVPVVKVKVQIDVAAAAVRDEPKRKEACSHKNRNRIWRATENRNAIPFVGELGPEFAELVPPVGPRPDQGGLCQPALGLGSCKSSPKCFSYIFFQVICVHLCMEIPEYDPLDDLEEDDPLLNQDLPPPPPLLPPPPPRPPPLGDACTWKTWKKYLTDLTEHSTIWWTYFKDCRNVNQSFSPQQIHEVPGCPGGASAPPREPGPRGKPSFQGRASLIGDRDFANNDNRGLLNENKELRDAFLG